MLKEPTEKLIRKYVESHSATKQYRNEGEALAQLFKEFPNNERIEDIILKVTVVNNMYKTNVLATYKMAEHIKLLDIDEKLRSKCPEVVEDIANLNAGGIERRHYSFATKYCHNHDRENYPIYDKYVDKMLWEYHNKKKEDGFCRFHRDELKNYKRLKEVLNAFREYYKLTQFNFKEIDNFLWGYGRELFGKTKA